MANLRFGGQSASMFLCGDDGTAKRTVAGLAEALGFEPVESVPLRKRACWRVVGGFENQIGIGQG